MFLTHKALLIISPRYAFTFVNAREPELCPFLEVYPEIGDSSRRTDFSAQVTVIFAITYVINKMRRPDTFDP
jgi:hypothetical protein